MGKPRLGREALRFEGLDRVAVAQGRNRIAWREIGWLRPLIGIAAFFAVLLVHPA